jgi:hypothetical protein
MDIMTNKKLATIALLGITMLVLVANPAFAEKSTITAHSNGKHHKIGVKDNYTPFYFNDDCGAQQSAWWDPTSYVAPSSSWLVSWDLPATIDGSCGAGVSFSEMDFELVDNTAGWSAADNYSYSNSSTGTSFSLVDSNNNSLSYSSGDQLTAGSSFQYGTSDWNNSEVSWYA